MELSELVERSAWGSRKERRERNVGAPEVRLMVAGDEATGSKPQPQNLGRFGETSLPFGIGWGPAEPPVGHRMSCG